MAREGAPDPGAYQGWTGVEGGGIDSSIPSGGGAGADSGWLTALLDMILNAGGATGPGETDEEGPGTVLDPASAFELFAGTPDNFFPGANLARVIFPPGPIRPEKSDQAMGALAALLANQYNRRRGGGGAGGGAQGDIVQALGGLVGNLASEAYGGTTVGGYDDPVGTNPGSSPGSNTPEGGIVYDPNYQHEPF